MAELFWTFQKYQLSAAAEGIGDVYAALVSQMKKKGWKGVEHQQDVHGYKPGIDLFAAVVFLRISGSQFWQGIAVGGGNATQQQAQQELTELQNIIAGLTFL
ncbi:hypothetical protein [Mycobacterium sp.]|uniref:hypothetical protein n=1 Tax=Mycobacterium sp. TaxID=1785 RepID=UPI002B918480|nr:hypothetical protein [Mycobacterium sp.]HKP40671.1 hypothetical protein [Mycobacterium sp.]